MNRILAVAKCDGLYTSAMIATTAANSHRMLRKVFLVISYDIKLLVICVSEFEHCKNNKDLTLLPCLALRAPTNMNYVTFRPADLTSLFSSPSLTAHDVARYVLSRGRDVAQRLKTLAALVPCFVSRLRQVFASYSASSLA